MSYGSHYLLIEIQIGKNNLISVSKIFLKYLFVHQGILVVDDNSDLF